MATGQPRWDSLLINCRLATMTEGGWGLVEDGALAVKNGAIAFAGRRSELPAGASRAIHDLSGAWVTPGLVDCHTHLVFAGDRSNEFEARLAGASYEDISRAGGGIQATVSATRAASESELLQQSLPRGRSLAAEGVTTLEIKSGYGLDLETELRMLRVAAVVGETLGITVLPTCLAAHAIPPEYAGRSDAYVDFIVETVLPAVAEGNLATTVDAYCETLAFSPAQVRRVLHRGQELGFAVKLHADQLSDQGGAALAAEADALSADHLEYTNQDGVAAMARHGTVAVLLPGAFHYLKEPRPPPVDRLRDAGVPMAIASDCNPGTSPLTSILLAMHLATVLFGLTPEEALLGVTRRAAQALGLQDRGTLQAGQRADLAVWSIEHPRELSYWAGLNPLRAVFVGGEYRAAPNR